MCDIIEHHTVKRNRSLSQYESTAPNQERKINSKLNLLKRQSNTNKITWPFLHVRSENTATSPNFSLYLREGGHVFVDVCLFVCWYNFAQKLSNGFA